MLLICENAFIVWSLLEYVIGAFYFDRYCIGRMSNCQSLTCFSFINTLLKKYSFSSLTIIGFSYSQDCKRLMMLFDHAICIFEIETFSRINP